MLAHAPSPRPLLAAMLDTATIFLRHNLRKRLDVDTYVLAPFLPLSARAIADLPSPSFSQRLPTASTADHAAAQDGEGAVR